MSGLLDQIQSTEDLKRLKKQELIRLSREVRQFLLRSVSKTGGHLASNLGVVELTIALEYCFHLPQDKIVWDVGHQSYVHKILTGRKERFDSLRQLDGISGFPKPKESPCDAFATGHSSTSISVAFGMAKARDLLGENYAVAAVIGDGSMTGGLAYEAMNHAGRENTNLMVILNDNQMSIDTNVGAMSKHLNHLRISERYQSVKESVRQLSKVPVIGKPTVQVLEKVKDSAKSILLESGVLFEEMGFRYIGPIDGHDIETLIEVISQAKKLKGPVLIHVKTVKGKGYPPAEQRPWDFHGVSAFDIKTGKTLHKSDKPDYSAVFGRKLVSLAEKNEKIVAITAAMAGGTGLSLFQKKFPSRFFDVAIAEQHGVTFAAGLASQGVIPVFAVYSTFLQRGYDQLVHDVCLSNLHVVFAIDRAGVVGADGETHQGVFDLSYLSHLPNMTVLSPKNAWELEEMLAYAVEKCSGPVALRYPRGVASEAFPLAKAALEYGKAEVICHGEKVALLAEGHMLEAVEKAAELLREDGFLPTVVNMRFIKPLDTTLLRHLAQENMKIFTIEDNVRAGGFGAKVLEYYADAGLFADVTNLAFPDHFIEQGTQAQLFSRYGLDAEGIFCSVKKKMGDTHD